MSQCQAVNCEIYSSSEIKDFNGCNTLKNLSPSICVIGPTSSSTTTDRTCQKRSDVTETSLIRSQTECNVPSDSENPQIECEEKTGCKWTYTDVRENPIQKMCKPTTSLAYTCDSDTTFSKNYSRYGYVDSSTFGCDKINCEYTPSQRQLVEGVCTDNDGSDGGTCGDLNKTQCLSADNDNLCIWIANDEEYCGYNRNIEYYIEKINEGLPNINNINSIGDVPADVHDPCTRVQNPGREQCERNGCIWDIYGNRQENLEFNEIPDPSNAGAMKVDPFYYDINTTGLCRTPVAEKCMDYFCTRSSQESTPTYKLPDGICKNSTITENTCAVNNKHIIAHKTPGLITFLPPGNIYPDHLARNNWGHETIEQEEITQFNKLLGLEYNQSKSSTQGSVKDLVLNNFQKHYKENCEKNLIYPSSSTIAGQYDISNNKKQYDEDTDICSNSNETIYTNTMNTNTMCDNFYHKDLSVSTYQISNSCSVIDVADIVVSNGDRITELTNAPSGGLLSDQIYGYSNTQNTGPITSEEINNARVAEANTPTGIIQNNLVCNRKFLEIIKQIKTDLLDWDENIYYLGSVINSDVSELSNIVNLGGGGASPLSINILSTDMVPPIHADLLGNFSPIDDSGTVTNTYYYPITEIGAGLILNSLIYKANVIDDTDFKSALTNLFGVATRDSDIKYTWTPNTGKISSDIKTKIESRILNIANKVQFGLISYDEYKDELSRFIASLLVYTGTEGTDTGVQCAYDNFNNTYSSYVGTIDNDATINPNNHIFEAINDNSQVLGGTQSDTTINYYDLIGNSQSELEENISTTHSIKDIVHRKGTAILTFQLYQIDGPVENKIEMTEEIKNQFFDTNVSIYFDKTGYRSPPGTSLKITQGDGNDETIFDDADTNVYTIKDGPNIYVGGILEIEVDNIEPGCLGDLRESNTCQSNIYMINSNGDYKIDETLNGVNYMLSLKEIRLKDNPIDIYFNGDIDGLYRKNEIISIIGLENNTFNNNLTFDNTSYYQIISEVDTINNRITIKNGTRKGKYFLGREDLEMNHYKEPTFCRIVPYSGGTTGDNSDKADQPKCDTIDEIYKHCKKNIAVDHCNGDDLCNYDDSYSRCLPIQPADLIDNNGNTKCYENIVNSNMKPTKCYYDATSGNYSYEFKDFFTADETKAVPDTSNIVEHTNIANFYKLFGIDGVDQNSFFDNWRIEYLDATGQKRIGRIHSHLYLQDDYTSNIKIKKLNEDRTLEVEEDGNIFILSIRPPKNSNSQAASSNTNFYEPSIVTIKSYLKQDVSIDDTDILNPNSDILVNNKLLCDFNNGKWTNRKCADSGFINKNIRGVDLCENTGFMFDENQNICYKEYEGSNVLYSTVTYNDYCSSKTNKSTVANNATLVNWTTNNISSDEEKRPCSVCSFINGPDNTHHCEPLSKLDCLRMTKDQCESSTQRPGNGGLFSTSSSCEFYRHNMDHETITINNEEKQIRYADFVCEQNITSDTSTCNSHQRLEDCESTNPNNPTGCEWKCPYTSFEHPGYNVTLNNGGSTPTKTELNDPITTNYYSKSELNVTCDTSNGWQTIDSTETPRAYCSRNLDNNTRNNHSEILGYLGCIKSLNCKNDIYTQESINNMDIRMVPNEFKTNGEIDPEKRPNEDGTFRCPLPKSLKSNPEGTVGWSEEICCQNIGLCTGNDISANDVTCPTGQQIKQTYYGDNTVLQSEIGTSVIECCEAPEAPTITQMIELTNTVGNIINSGSSEYEEFRSQFIQDLLEILNRPDSGIGFTVTSEMISILDIVEPLGNNIEVTFKILKNTDGNVVNKEKLTRLLVPGTTFTRVGGVANTSPHFRPYDPKSKYLYYSDKFKKGITIEEVGISVFLTFSLCLFCLVILGIVLK